MSAFSSSGRSRSFDLLGYYFRLEGVSVGKKTVEKFVARCIRLYEQEPEEALAPARLEFYVRRWIRWTGAGLGHDDREIRITPDFQSMGLVCT